MFFVHVPRDMNIVLGCVVITLKDVCDNSFVSKLHDVINIIVKHFPDFPSFLSDDFNFPNITWLDAYLSLTPFVLQYNEFLNMF